MGSSIRYPTLLLGAFAVVAFVAEAGGSVVSEIGAPGSGAARSLHAVAGISSPSATLCLIAAAVLFVVSRHSPGADRAWLLKVVIGLAVIAVGAAAYAAARELRLPNVDQVGRGPGQTISEFEPLPTGWASVTIAGDWLSRTMLAGVAGAVAMIGLGSSTQGPENVD